MQPEATVRSIRPISEADGPKHSRTARATPAGPLVTVADAITFARLAFVPLVFWLVLRHDLTITFGVFVAAGASAAVDGWLARRNGGGVAIVGVIAPCAVASALFRILVTFA